MMPRMKLRIRELRLARKWTNAKTAKLAGLSGGFLSQLENEKRLPGPETLDSLASAFNVEVADLIDASDEAPSFGLLIERVRGMGDGDLQTLVAMADVLKKRSEAS